MALTRRLGRDAVTWIALGLVVASILIVTTRHASATKLVQKQQSPAQSASQHQTTSAPSRTPRRSGAKSPPRYIGLSSPTTTTSLPTTTTAPVPTTTIAAGATSTVATSATLSYPSDIATTYPLDIGSGPLSVKLTWPKGSELTLALSCGRPIITRLSSRGEIDVTLDQVSGNCDLRIARVSMTGGPTVYSLFLSYLASNPAGSK